MPQAEAEDRVAVDLEVLDDDLCSSRVELSSVLCSVGRASQSSRTTLPSTTRTPSSLVVVIS
jgi:hypothetical protein